LRKSLKINMSDKEKIEVLLKELKHNPNSFAMALKYKRSDKIYHILNQRCGISRAVKNDIINTFPQVSRDWLFYSKGSVLSLQNDEQQRHEIYNVIEVLEREPTKEGWEKLKSLVFDVLKSNETYKTKLMDIRKSLTSGIFK